MVKIIYNCMQHDLTSDQISDLNLLYDNAEILNLKDTHIWGKIKESADNVYGLQEQVKEFIMSFPVEKDIIALILPVGSPAFMFLLAWQLQTSQVDILFAHSDKMSEDISQPDGSIKKISVFKFKHWIKF